MGTITNQPALADLPRVARKLAASAAQNATGTDDARAVTPWKLASRTATDTRAGVLETATQAEQETGTATDKIVTPGRQQFHPGTAKGWVQADVAGAATVSHNVSSVDDTATGQVTINWGTDFSGVEYVVVAIVEASANRVVTINSSTGPTAAATLIDCRQGNAADTLADPTNWQIVAVGDQ